MLRGDNSFCQCCKLAFVKHLFYLGMAEKISASICLDFKYHLVTGGTKLLSRCFQIVHLLSPALEKACWFRCGATGKWFLRNVDIGCRT